MKLRITLLLAALPILLTALSPAAVAVAGPAPAERRSIDTATYDDLFFHFKYASSAYRNSCPRPNGNVLVSRLDNRLTDTQGFIARDDKRGEIIAAFRGSESLWDLLIDLEFDMTPFNAAGISGPPGVMVHKGFHTAWESVATTVVSIIKAELATHPGYSIVTTGHSLGATLSSLAGITLKETFPNALVRMYTYGQLRTGNKEYAEWVNQRLGSDNLFRSVHTTDPAPHILPRLISEYTHHGVEYWTFKDPSSAKNTKKCASTGEDPECSAGIEILGLPLPLPLAHLFYFGVYYTTGFCL